MSQTIYFASPNEAVKCECYSLSHWQGYTIKMLEITGGRHSLSVASRMLAGEPGKIYFHPAAHKFHACPFGYDRNGDAWVSKDKRIIAEPQKLWPTINRAPFEAPMLPEWQESIELALRGPYVKSLAGFNSRGEYLSPALTPAKLDEVVTGLIKRKVLSFS